MSINQICFTNEADCTSFSGHMLKGNMCINCLKDISKHNKDSVKEEDLIKALEHTQKGEKIPSLILEGDTSIGSLYLGGFKAAINTEFVKKANIQAVVNTVGSGLFKLFGRRFENNYHETVKIHDLSCLFLEWEDSVSYDISDEDLENVIKHIHKARIKGGSVLVHCAQGKSRSSTAVVAYIMTVMNLNMDQALKYVQERRKMAEPNSHFMLRLHEYESSDLLTRLKVEVNR